MREKTKKILSSILIISGVSFLFSITAFGAVPDDLRNSIEQKAKELEEINNKIKENQEVLENVQGESKTLNQEISRLNSTVNQVNLSIQSSEVTITKLNLEVDSLQYGITDAGKQIIEKKEAIAAILREFQQREEETPMTIFLKSKSLADSVFEVQSLTDLNSGLSVEINNLIYAKEDLSNKLVTTAQMKGASEIESQNLKYRKIILNDTKTEKQTLLTQTKSQEKTYQRIISDLEKQQLEIANEINDLEEQLRLSFDPTLLPSKRPGVLNYPVENPFVTQEYGATAFAQRAYSTKFHNGMDFRAPIGSPIYAAEDGEVFAIGNNGRVQYGKFIVIKHDNNLATLYGHLSRQIVGVGSSVKKGDIIGYSGNTGYSTGPHLHFMVYWAPSVNIKSFPGAGLVPVGVTINPADYL